MCGNGTPMNVAMNNREGCWMYLGQRGSSVLKRPPISKRAFEKQLHGTVVSKRGGFSIPLNPLPISSADYAD